MNRLVRRAVLSLILGSTLTTSAVALAKPPEPNPTPAFTTIKEKLVMDYDDLRFGMRADYPEGADRLLEALRRFGRTAKLNWLSRIDGDAAASSVQHLEITSEYMKAWNAVGAGAWIHLGNLATEGKAASVLTEAGVAQYLDVREYKCTADEWSGECPQWSSYVSVEVRRYPQGIVDGRPNPEELEILLREAHPTAFTYSLDRVESLALPFPRLERELFSVDVPLVGEVPVRGVFDAQSRFKLKGYLTADAHGIFFDARAEADASVHVHGSEDITETYVDFMFHLLGEEGNSARADAHAEVGTIDMRDHSICASIDVNMDIGNALALGGGYKLPFVGEHREDISGVDFRPISLNKRECRSIGF